MRMENQVKVRLTEEAFARLQEAALAEGRTPAEQAAAEIERYLRAIGKLNATEVDKPHVEANID
jgi:hypothetical protein